MNRKFLAYVSILLGIVFLILAIVYWTVPAGSLPAYLPGYIAGSTAVHLKHGLAALVLALVLFAFGWFNSGKQLSH